MSKHTKGPWFLEGNWDPASDEVGGWVSSFPPGGMPVFELVPAVGTKEQIVANARLIAAAPDLLEALSWFINDIDGTHTSMVEFDENVAKARRAIAKAEGGDA